MLVYQTWQADGGYSGKRNATALTRRTYPGLVSVFPFPRGENKLALDARDNNTINTYVVVSAVGLVVGLHLLS